MRPVGGILADRVGGKEDFILGSFPATALMALFLACPYMSTFTIGALGMGGSDWIEATAPCSSWSGIFPDSVAR